MEGSGTCQGLILVSIVTWICVSSYLKLTHKFRSLVQPWVSRQVVGDVPLILNIQKHQNRVFDAFFSCLSCVVSVPFYTAFLPLLFWSGHGRLARQMTLLIAFCDYLGNCIKDVVSAPRPSCPPVRRITATKDEEDNAMEYGLPSSHTLNTVCLSGYLLHYVLSSLEHENASVQYYGFALACLLVALIAFGRIYLGMHSVVDIIAGLAIGVLILGLWLTVDEELDHFITSKQNVSSFWTALSFLLLFAYPIPEHPTPSYEYHTAFTGVALGIIFLVLGDWSSANVQPIPPRRSSTDLLTRASGFSLPWESHGGDTDDTLSEVLQQIPCKMDLTNRIQRAWDSYKIQHVCTKAQAGQWICGCEENRRSQELGWVFAKTP